MNGGSSYFAHLSLSGRTKFYSSGKVWNVLDGILQTHIRGEKSGPLDFKYKQEPETKKESDEKKKGSQSRNYGFGRIRLL